MAKRSANVILSQLFRGKGLLPGQVNSSLQDQHNSTNGAGLAADGPTLPLGLWGYIMGYVERM